MIIERHPETVETNQSNLKVIKFGIDNSEATIPLLIDFLSRLYSNPKQTLLFEYVANAYDSMHLAGKSDVPIEITIPNKFNPNFIVRDYGVSMDYNEVESIFAVALKSTKRDTNSTIGGYGVGKLVFAPYCGVMFLTTWKDNFKTIFQCRLKDGDGEITPIYKAPSDEPQGVEIKIPVPEKDFSFFQEKCEYSYSFFKTKPIIKGHRVNLEQEYFFQTENFSLLKNKDLVNNEAIATIGGIPFPINPRNVTNNYSDISLMDYTPVVFHFNVGEVDHTPSRDQLEYNDKTCGAIRNRLEEFKEHFKKHIFETVENLSDIHESRKFFYELKANNTSPLSNLASRLNVSRDIKFDGKEIKIHFQSTDDFWFSCYKVKQTRSTTQLKCSSANFHIYQYDSYVIDDGSVTDYKFRQRIKKYISDNNFEYIQVIKLRNGKTLQDFIDEFQVENMEFVNVSDLPDPEKQARSSGGYSSRTVKSGKVLEYDNYNNHSDKLTVHDWEETEVDLENDSGIYVPIKYYNPENCENLFDFTYMVRVLNQREPFTLYGVKSSEVKNLGSGFVSIDDYIQKKIKEYESKVLGWLNIYNSSAWIYNYRIDDNIDSMKELCPVAEYIKKNYDRISNRYNECVKTELLSYIKVLNALYKYIGKPQINTSNLVNKKMDKKLSKAVRVFRKKYPLLNNAYYPEEQQTYVKAMNFYTKSLTQEARSRILSV